MLVYHWEALDYSGGANPVQKPFTVLAEDTSHTVPLTSTQTRATSSAPQLGNWFSMSSGRSVSAEAGKFD